jgi:hypothetical protein
MLSLEEDLEKIKELENKITENNNNYDKIIEILNKYEIDIKILKIKLADIQQISKMSFTLLLVSYSHIIFFYFIRILNL